ncbi:mannitol-1-phosphate 5-dehydrogenase [Pontibacillus yanchengensis]|uniref:Mannitol-1-phosphate 5-dehydrogenase n=1 Tax=Pontibacillus yanchengensis Y32 TaxID=1385514 RepID=A0A0A2TBY4_9BACI|nr:mannitol-1-phosphate 5-dehydrogenase [Pontibacillus yanchengensis]KGP71923.1 mannitol-1-phosphate 5-dehydrogenase [Pontibacillus yanchengensis Y32]
MLAVHFGAGNIGRGFIGELLYASNYETIFVDVNETLIDQLNQRQSYTVELAGSGEKIDVHNVSGLNSISQKDAVVDAIVNADIITTAVGPHILSAISEIIAQGLEKRLEQGKSPINIIACENMIGGSEQLKAHILDHINYQKDTFEKNVGFPNAAVDRIVPDQNNDDPLTVKVEPYYEWVVETSDIKGEKPPVQGIKYVDDLTPFIERKLFTVNTGHAGAAYLGRYYGHQTIKQAMDDPTIVGKVRAALHESGSVLIEKYNFSKEEHHEYIEKIIERFLNPDLSDEVTRVGRAPKRKLGSNDRLIRPALEYIEWVGKDPENLSEIIAAALLYKDDNDDEASSLHQSVKEKGAIETLKEVAELEDDSRLVKAVETRLNEMK